MFTAAEVGPKRQKRPKNCSPRLNPRAAERRGSYIIHAGLELTEDDLELLNRSCFDSESLLIFCGLIVFPSAVYISITSF